MAGTRMKKDVDSSSKKKVVAAPGTNWALSIAVICVTMVTFSIFGYILAHSHLTLGKYDERLKFITNKIETFAKNNADLAQNTLKIPITLRIPVIGADPHIIDAYDMKSPPETDPSLDSPSSTNAIENFLGNIMHLIHRDQLPPELVEEHASVDHTKQHLAGGVAKNSSAADILVNLNHKTSENIQQGKPSNSSLELSNGVIRHPHVLKCPHGDLLTFWRNPTKYDIEYVTPFKNYGPAQKYVTFEPDFGGWNNIRMQMELVLVFAAATGRTLVLPPDQPMYLLHHGSGHQKHHNFADFFPFEHIKTRVDVITMEEYMMREGITGNFKNNLDGSTFYPPGNKTAFDATDRDERKEMWHYLRNVSSCPPWKSMFEFVIIPFAPGVNSSLLANASYYEKRRNEFAAERKASFYDDYWQNQKYLHFISDPSKELRLLEHFYTFLHFEDEAMDRLYKRFVRDYVHYVDTIFCKAALIINKLNEESNGSFSTFHIRRGEFQYKEVKISAKELVQNVGHLLPAGQLLYIATDEKNKSFFDDFSPLFPRLRFMDDYMGYAELNDINPNFLGMIDQVICTRGQYFVGTWFSTFSGYITRMRGYLGYHDYSVYYGDKKRRDRFHHFELPKFPFYMREWNISWYNIDE